VRGEGAPTVLGPVGVSHCTFARKGENFTNTLQLRQPYRRGAIAVLREIGSRIDCK